MSIATILRDGAQALGADLTIEAIEPLLTAPRNRELGDVAFPCFVLAGPLRKAPHLIAAELAAAIQPAIETSPTLAGVEAVGPYLNFRFDLASRARAVLQAAIKPGYGEQSVGAGLRVGIDYSSPNIAKPFGIGHLRSTAIGAAIGRILEALGYEVVRVNHIGDWGTQFGKLIVAFERWGDEEKLAEDPIQHLYDLYVKFHDAAKEDAALDDEGRAWFLRLEQGDEQATAYWQRFRELSLGEFNRIYDRLGVHFDYTWGEAYYNDQLDALVADVEARGLTTESEGALVVPMHELELPPCLLRKQDGATLYATRDLAAARYRMEKLRLNQLLYVVGHAQSVHFKQVFEVLRRMEYDWADELVHIPFGMILGISTRKGTLVFLEDILDRGRDLVLEHLADKPDFTDEERQAIAEQIAIGAVVFYDLSRNRIKDYEFSWEAILKGLKPGERGPTGVYLQYTLARLNSVREKYLGTFGALPDGDGVAWDRLVEEDAQALIAHLETWPLVLRQAAEAFEPAVVARFALELAELFNGFYSGGHQIVSEDTALSAARMSLALGARETLAMALGLLGVPVPARI